MIAFIFVLFLAFLLFAIGLVALLSSDAGPTVPICIIFRLHLDANASPRFKSDEMILDKEGDNNNSKLSVSYSKHFLNPFDNEHLRLQVKALPDLPVIPGVTRIATNHRSSIVHFSTCRTNPNSRAVRILLKTGHEVKSLRNRKKEKNKLL